MRPSEAPGDSRPGGAAAAGSARDAAASNLATPPAASGPAPRGAVLVVTGTDTGVGKTHVAAWLIRRGRAQGLRMGAYKPVCSGAEPIPGLEGQPIWNDVERLAAELGPAGDAPSEDASLEELRRRICPQRFLAPLAPPIAAQLEGRTVDRNLLFAGLRYWTERSDVVIVEGVGGWCCPLTADWTFADFAAQVQAPVVVVAPQRLGVISHAVLTVRDIQRRGLTAAGVLLNCPQEDSSPRPEPLGLPAAFDFAGSNGEWIVKLSGAPSWGRLPFGEGREVVRQRSDAELDFREFLNVRADHHVAAGASRVDTPPVSP